MIKIAVIMFPGNNCENETARAVEAVGIKADIVRWNIIKGLEKYDGYILPGGFSYEDRIRGGIISAQDPIMNIIKEQAYEGKPVLGICNGAQTLIESALVPGLKDKVEMALAPNKNPFVSGYYCTWVNIKLNGNKKCAFTKLFKKNAIISIPIAHAEGKFTTTEKDLIKKLIGNGQIIFRYCNEKGKIEDKFPINPNGSMYNIAGLCNKKGNVLAMMPHPERASFKRQSPKIEKKNFREMKKPMPARKIFESMKIYIEERIR